MKKQVILSIFIASIMILSILGFSLSYQDPINSTKYNNNVFKETTNGWLTYKENTPVIISNNPSNLQNIQLPEISLEELNSADTLYMSFDPRNNIRQALSSFQVNIQPLLRSFIPACSDNLTECSNLPIKTCNDTSFNTKIIQFQESIIPLTTYENNCLLIQGPQQEITKQTDALILKLLNI